MTFTRVGAATGTVKTSGQTSWTVTTTGAGNLFCFAVTVQGSSTITANSISGGGVNAWATAGAAIHDASLPGSSQMWWGVVGTPGTSTITVGFTSTPGANQVVTSYTEYNSSVAGTWSLATSNGIGSTSNSTVITWPSLTPTVSGQLYVGKEIDSGSTTSAGATAGCTYAIDTAFWYWVFNPNTTAALAPTCSVTPSCLYMAHGAIFANTPAFVSTGWFEMFE